MFTWVGHYKFLCHILTSCLALGCLSVIGKRKKLGPWEDLLLVDLLLPDMRVWLVVGQGYSWFVGCLQRRETDVSLWHLRETSHCAPAKGGETNFLFDSQLGCHLGFCRGACVMGWCHTYFFIISFFFFFSLVLSFLRIVSVVGG